MVIAPDMNGRKTLDHKLQEHLVEGKRYARLGVFKMINVIPISEGDVCYYNFQNKHNQITGYRAKQVLNTHPLILYN
jgi:hypothetical protein